MKRNSLSALFAALILAALPATAEDWHADFAKRVHEAYVKVEPMPQLSAAHPEATLADGYAIQKLVLKALLNGKAPAGFKAAIVAAPGQKALGIDGPLAAVIPSGGALCACEAVTVDLKEDPARHLETEIGYIIGKAITAPLPDVETLRAHIKSVAGMVEVPGGPVEQVKPPTAADLAAWNINGKLVIVGDHHDPEKIDEDAVEVALKRDGEVVNTGQGANAAGGQWETLRKTINTLLKLGYTLEPEQIVTNGALGKVVKAEPGDYEADFGPLGVVVFDVVAAE